MAAPATSYDLVLILSTTAEDAARQAVADDVRARIDAQGTVLETRDWGVRPLAYPIDDQPTGDYRLYRFQGPAALIAELDRVLRITDPVLRHRTIALDAQPLDPPDLRSTEPVATGAPAAAPADDDEE